MIRKIIRNGGIIIEKGTPIHLLSSTGIRIMPGYFLRNGSEHFLVHNHHQTEDQQQVHRKQGHMDVVGDQTEQGRHCPKAEAWRGCPS